MKAHARLNAARAEHIPGVSLVMEHVYLNGAPLLPESSAAVGVLVDWKISEFGGHIGKVRERKAKVAKAEEYLHGTENRVCMDVQSEIRKIHRSETELEAPREDVAARTELVRITNDRAVAKAATESS